MRHSKFFLVAAMISLLSMTSQSVHAANCKKITALGETLTYDSAVLFANNALKNTLASKGLIGKGKVTTSCKSEGAMTTCRSSQMACTGGTPKSCLGAWLCF